MVQKRLWILIFTLFKVRSISEATNNSPAETSSYIITIGKHKSPVADDTKDGSTRDQNENHEYELLTDEGNNDYISTDLFKTIYMTLMEYFACTDKFCDLLKKMQAIENECKGLNIVKGNLKFFVGIREFASDLFNIGDGCAKINHQLTDKSEIARVREALQGLKQVENIQLSEIENNIQYAFVVKKLLDCIWMTICRYCERDCAEAEIIFEKLASFGNESDQSKSIAKESLLQAAKIYKPKEESAMSENLGMEIGNLDESKIKDYGLSPATSSEGTAPSHMYSVDVQYQRIHAFLATYKSLLAKNQIAHVQLNSTEYHLAFSQHITKDVMFNKLKFNEDRCRFLYIAVNLQMPKICLYDSDKTGYNISDIFDKTKDLSEIAKMLTIYRNKIIEGYFDKDFSALATLKTNLEEYEKGVKSRTVNFVLFTDKNIFPEFFDVLLKSKEEKDAESVKHIMELYNEIYRYTEYAFASRLSTGSVRMFGSVNAEALIK